MQYGPRGFAHSLPTTVRVKIHWRLDQGLKNRTRKSYKAEI